MLLFLPSGPRWLISSFWRFVKILLKALGSVVKAIYKSHEKKKLWPNLVSILFHSKPFLITWRVSLGPFREHVKILHSHLKPTFWVLKMLNFLFCITTLTSILGDTILMKCWVPPRVSFTLDAHCNKPPTCLLSTFTIIVINQHDEVKNSNYFPCII